MSSRVFFRCARFLLGAGIAIVLSLGAEVRDAAAQSAGGRDNTFQYSAFYLGPSIDVLQGMARQADGKIVAAGYARGFVVVRFMPDGMPDASFGTAGVASIGLNALNSTSTRASVSIQPDGKILLASGGSGFGVARLNADGTPDTGFGTAGIATHLVNGLTGYTTAIHLLADGRIIAAGYASNAGNADFALARYLANGTLDTTFNGTGTAVVAVGAGADIAYGVTTDTAGRIVVAGYSYNGTDNDFALVRLTPEGPLDATFGTSGKLVTGISGNDGAVDVFVLADGRIVAAGWTSSTQMALARYDANGALDATFGTGGIVTVAGGTGTRAALQSDGKLVMLATNTANTVLARFNANGSLDAGFGTAGLQTTPDPVSSADAFGSLVIQPDGTIVAGGTVDDDFALRRHGANGTVDATFGITGLVSRELGRGEGGRWAAVRVLDDGRILAAGAQAGTTKARIIVARFLESGAQDAAFGTGGVFAARCPSPRVAGMDVQEDGRIVVAGSCRWGNDDLFALRLLPDGRPDASFGGIGMVFADLGGAELAYAMALQPDGKIIVGGSAEVGSSFEGVVIRIGEDGALDAGFGADGRAVFDLGDRDNEIHALALQPDGKILAAGYFDDPVRRLLLAVLLRFVPGGTLDASFAGDGVLPLLGTRGEFLGYVDGTALLVNPDRILLAGAGTTTVGAFIAGITPEGQLDTTFGLSGSIEIGQWDSVSHLAMQWQSKLLAIGSAGTTIHAKRFNVDGTVDLGFNDQSHGEGPPTGFAEAWNYKALVGGTTTPEFHIERFFLENGGRLASPFATLADVPIASLVTSAPVTITYGGVPVRSRNGAFSVGCTGSFTAGPVVVATSQTVCVRHYSASTPGTTTTTQLAIGGATFTFSSVTAKDLPAMSLAASAASVKLGASVSLTATLSMPYGAPTGIVTFRDGATAVAAASVNASAAAQATVTPSALGAHTFIAEYAGDATYLPQASNAVVVTVEKADTTSSAVVSPSPSTSGAPVTITASVQGYFPTGTVSFLDFGAVIPGCGSVALSGTGATCGTASLAAGVHSIAVSYSGDANNNPSASFAVPHLVTGGAPSYFTLVVLKSGAGSGTVTSNPAGIDCGATCVANFSSGAVVALTASAATGFTFTGWSGGGCSGTGTCNVTMDTGKSVVATFSNQPFSLTVSKTGGGSGLVTSTPPGIDCGATCSAGFDPGTSVALGAAPATDSYFAGWSGACTGTGACNVTMDAVKSVTATFKLNTTIPRLANIATRMQVLTGDNVLIGGFIIGGSQAKKVVVRARGPSLTAAGVPGALQNPALQLFNGQLFLVANDDWQQAANATALQNSGFAPADPKESAILTTLGPGAYTAIVSGVGGTTGVGIVEVFEVDRPEVPLINIATRGQVLTNADVMIGGFIIQGDSPQTVIVRARGPSLTAAGVPGALQDPVLQLFSGQTPIGSNDDWQTDANAGQIQSRGFAPSDARESAILATLPPGAYTAIVTGKNGTTGVGIVEVFAQ